MTAKSQIEALRHVINNPPRPGVFSGRGVVTCAGGKYFPGAWVLVNRLRDLGCDLPIEVWYRGPSEMSSDMLKILSEFGAHCIDGFSRCWPGISGWEMKAAAVAGSSFSDVLFIDADNVPSRDPSFLFNEKKYADTGSLFWPDYRFFYPDSPVWSLFELPAIKARQFESGQFVVNKKKCWRALCGAVHMSRESKFYYSYMYGDKDTFQMAWRITKTPYTFIQTPPGKIPHTIVQYDLTGDPLFYHRNGSKWRVPVRGVEIPGFPCEQRCREHLRTLEKIWSGDLPEKKTAKPIDYGKYPAQRQTLSFGPTVGMAPATRKEKGRDGNLYTTGKDTSVVELYGKKYIFRSNEKMKGIKRAY